ncbi:noelin-2-like [Lingula anatina]|nr:noelin-2-like [Lingula anatina]|eukprot:XP_013404487.1 noelin-2-like [Lingula anatina]
MPTIENSSGVFQYNPANSRQSAWMRDSQPTNQSSANRVWFFRGFVRDNAVIMFDSVEAMKRNHSRETIRLPYNWAGTGHVVYRDSVYFQRALTKNIVKFDFKNRTAMIEASMRDVDGGNTCTYPWRGYTTTDFAVDEYGLWLVYGNISNNCNLVIAKINPDTLNVEKSWATTISSGSVGNTFMKCGVLYATNSYSELSNYIRYTYDTNTGKQESLPPNGIPFKPPGKYNTMLDYNPHDGLLYYADMIKGNLATFPIV